MGLLTTATTLLLLASSGHLVTADSAAAPAAIPRITSLTFSGPGCTRDPKHTGGLSDPTFSFSNFASSLPGTTKTLNCQAHLQASGASPGWQVAVTTNTVKGNVYLTPGTSLEYYTTVFFSQDAAKTGTVRGHIAANDKTVDQAVTLVSNTGANKVWSPCTGADGSIGILNVNFRTVLNGEGKAYFEALTENWDLEWRKC
ncbi:hypothetical protein B0T21DRAFT_344032 [Apiosordaria backusii]|uniref:Secreted protein n=1 Tax=Apiosordaria backusii TaxID=314023 RepID=A0AA40EZE2_9PEZI|nr:hypothetical protein B0T21DRAFT_344032 [Apiosordaria backusii]